MAAALHGAGDFLTYLFETGQFLKDEGIYQGKYAFRVLPDAILSGSLFLTFLLGWNLPLAMFSIGLIITGFSQEELANMIQVRVPSLARVGGLIGPGVDVCSGHFPGTSWSRLLSLIRNPSDLLDGMVPSYYMTVIGYLLGFSATQAHLFKAELSKRPGTSANVHLGIVVAGLLSASTGLLRIATGCEPWWCVILSLLMGVILAIVYVGITSSIFGRRSVNILQLPLFEGRIPDGKPIYVCADKAQLAE